MRETFRAVAFDLGGALEEITCSGLAIQIRSFLTDKADKETNTDPPDAVVRDLQDITPLVTSQ